MHTSTVGVGAGVSTLRARGQEQWCGSMSGMAIMTKWQMEGVVIVVPECGQWCLPRQLMFSKVKQGVDDVLILHEAVVVHANISHASITTISALRANRYPGVSRMNA